ncbi:lysine-specific demethylase 8 [Xanthomonas arboricola]|uniref:cupin-like domain-containing protein n=1 Tax=Xanthomonas euroxanthea TaxID=2259622 RepID=UPI0014316008|nr:cupin-like domain-containing protein [Xanthomonas euroxanthea]NJC37114.1 lysine-specific demethylase 8 [Xanthomonas euroxanthea]
MEAKEIARISRPDAALFLRDYVQTRTPVIITDLFAGERIDTIRTKADASAAFGSVPLHVQTEYAVAASSPETAVETTMTFDQYWAHVREHPDTALLSTEYEIPAKIMQMFRLPELCLADDLHEPEVLDMPRKYGDHDLCANIFVANQGNRAHLHFDGDHRQVLLHQLFGRKRVLLFQPETCIHLRTAAGSPWSSGVYLERMSPQEQLDFVAEVGGYHAVLQPGETIYMPALIWHYLGYIDDAMSFNLRFKRNRFGRFLCVDNVHRDSYIQNLGSRLAGSHHHAGYARLMPEIEAEYVRPRATLREKVIGMRTVLRSACAELLPDTASSQFCPPQLEGQEVDKIIADIGETARYVEPTLAARSRPVGAISPVQKQTIERTAARLGYSGAVLSHLLWNRLGKLTLDSLTKTEAVQFMVYMRSPGAAL